MKKFIFLLFTFFVLFVNAQVLQSAKILILPNIQTLMDKTYPANTFFYNLNENELIKINNSIQKNTQIDTTQTEILSNFLAVETNNFLRFSKLCLNNNELIDSIYVQNNDLIEISAVLMENSNKRFIFNKILIDTDLKFLFTEMYGTGRGFLGYFIRNNYLIFRVCGLGDEAIQTNLTLKIN